MHCNREANQVAHELARVSLFKANTTLLVLSLFDNQ
jgi:hypothetical protein